MPGESHMSDFTIEAIRDRSGLNNAARTRAGLPSVYLDNHLMMVEIDRLQRKLDARDSTPPTEDLSDAQAKLAMTGTEPGIRGGKET